MPDALRTILTLSLSGSLLALLLFAIKPVLKNRVSKAFSYYIWILVLLRLAIPFSAPVNVTNAVFGGHLPDKSGLSETVSNAPDTGADNQTPTAGTTHQAGMDGQTDSAAAVSQSPAAAQTSASPPDYRVPPLIALWGIGAAVSFGWFIVSYALFSRRIRQSFEAPDAGPDIWRTTDGGQTWSRLDIELPEAYRNDDYRFTPLSPTFSGEEGRYPIQVYKWRADNNYDLEHIDMYTHDGGLSWSF